MKLLNDESDDEAYDKKLAQRVDEDDWVPVLDPNSQIAKKKCDLAIISFVRTFLDIKTNRGLKEYVGKNLGRSSIDMGFGLHCGWAIEGAIGSDHKIDAR